MADRTVRAIFQAVTSPASKGMRDFSKDVADAGKKVDTLTKDLKGLDKVKANPKIDLAIEAAERQIKDITAKLGDLRTMEVTPEVTADIRQAERQLADARKALRQLNAAKAEMTVTADTRPARKAVDDLADDVGDAGAEGGEQAGENIASGILSALQTIPIAGAVIGVGAAIAGGILVGIKQGLAIEAERDLFSAQTGLDEDTSARFGRAAGEAYANAWGDSVAANLDTARRAMQAGIINSEATDAEIESVIAKLQGLNDLFEYDIAESVRGVGNLMRTGLVRDADQAFDLIVAASQKVSSDDLIDTLTEYSNQFVTLGLTAEESFGLIVQGAQAGARDTDNIADTLKEMGLRVREGTKPAIDALDALGLEADAIVTAFQEGGPDAVAAMDKVFDALRDLEAKGGNTQEVIAALFGGPGEDLGAALFALDLTTVSDALGGIDGAAGAAQRALDTLGDNAATKIETAKRNIEIAMDGIKGALAAAFEDDIAGAAEWVESNRAPLMEFFLDVINGAFEMGKAFVEFGATAIEALADLAEAAADILVFLPGFSLGDKKALQEEADGLRDAASGMRTEFVGALDDMQDKANAWAAPEIMAARVHDATRVMSEDVDAFNAVVASAGGTIKINGDTLDAEQAWLAFLEGIDEEDGTVTINGNTVEAEDAVAEFLVALGENDGEVSIGGDDTEAKKDVRGLLQFIGTQGTSVKVRADTSSANETLRLFLRDRTMTVRVVTSGASTLGGLVRGTHDGGWVGQSLPGLHAGGRVPGSNPGYDNVLWPLNIGGRILQQPLTGGEYVVNPKASADNAALLEFLNAGGKLVPSSTSQTYDQGVHIENLYANAADAESLQRERRKYQSTRSLG